MISGFVLKLFNLTENFAGFPYDLPVDAETHYASQYTSDEGTAAESDCHRTRSKSAYDLIDEPSEPSVWQCGALRCSVS